MIFWMLLTITLLIGAVTWEVADYYERGLSTFFAMLLCGFVSFFVILACGTWIPWNNDVVRSDTYKLRTIGSGNGIEGRAYFLGGGYINSTRILNYVADAGGGAINVRMADAAVSTVYEDAPAGTGTVEVKHIDHINGWVVPWPLGAHDEYVFHIPAGSITNDFGGIK